VNLASVFNMTRNVIEGMRERSYGRIINISSINGQKGQMGQANYSAAKLALTALSKSIALHCAKKQMNIRCNSVHPTFVDTPILDGTAKAASLDKGVLLEKLARQIPLKFVGEPNDIANAVLYLASDESRFMTGAELKLDGGISAM
jgi:NAD(P)-dependent dehydrogenase (short-subunit alcohol dehydrogenase family)